MFVNKYTNILTYSESIVLHPGTHCVSNNFFFKCDSCFFGGLRESIQPKVDPSISFWVGIRITYPKLMLV